MTSRFMVDWNEERITTLKALWTEGLSCSAIAERLGNGITRNAVIGKVHRLNLNGVVRAPVVKKPHERKPKDKPSLASAAANSPKARRALLAPVPITIPDLPENGRLTLLQLSERTCKWPIGDPQDKDFCFCGHTPRDQSPYCDYHARLSYQPRDPSKRNFRYG
jgi:GcrA cell cycle regulator